MKNYDALLIDFGWFAAGALCSFAINLISPPVYIKLRNWILKIRRIHRTKSNGEIFINNQAHGTKFCIGNLKLDFIALQCGYYSPKHIQTFYSPKSYPLHPEFEKMKIEFVNDIERRSKRGEFGLPYNGLTYKLVNFDVASREIIDGDEVPVLKLNFAQTDYFTQKITDLNTTNTFRNQIASKYNLIDKPVQEFASILGVNYNLITSDGYLIISLRSVDASVNAGIYHTSVGENLLRPADGKEDGSPDLFKCAQRGIKEEIGISLDISDIKFTVFGAYSPWCQYKIIGFTELTQTKREIEFLHSNAVAKDKWENSSLEYIKCNPKSLATLIQKTKNNWYDIGIACVIYSLYQIGYKPEDVKKEFENFDFS